ncbi:amino acid ABC transporter permease [Acetobacter syzygii]|nr:amino acid ABC transporter permease [Acetobacter syzygii]NSL92664.1 amino acid ABC transporter permease [Acetobacter syzygii]GAN70154.1 ABC transporter polar amino acid permease inner membrane subunit [Acetobacter syzygii]GBR66322.1 polar amino acid ABC transporter permease [Acetobacter syzygii NRIC 0483]GEL57112.1 cystine ABC transporter permease [Acetobacter syzygii]
MSVFWSELQEYFPFLLMGAKVTLELSFISMAGGMVLGFLAAIGRLSENRLIRWPLEAYVEIWRDTPLIVQLLLIYFSLPEFGIVLSGFWAGVLGLTLNLSAYLSEVYRAAIIAVDPGQKAAAISLGMSPFQVYRRLIVPQAFVACLPTQGGYFIALLKDCSLVSFISVNELLRHATIVISNTFDSMNTYLMVAVIYFCMSFTSARCVGWLERTLTPARRKKVVIKPIMSELAEEDKTL